MNLLKKKSEDTGCGRLQELLVCYCIPGYDHPSHTHSQPTAGAGFLGLIGGPISSASSIHHALIILSESSARALVTLLTVSGEKHHCTDGLCTFYCQLVHLFHRVYHITHLSRRKTSGALQNMEGVVQEYVLLQGHLLVGSSQSLEQIWYE